MKQLVSVGIFLLLLILPDSVPIHTKKPASEPGKRIQMKTAVWLKLDSDTRIDNILNRIRQNKISLIYLQTSKKNPDRPAKNRHFISRIQRECPETRIFPWIGMVIRSPAVFKAKNLLQKTITFTIKNNLSGLHLDFEPPFGSQTFEYLEDYFLFLETFKNRLKPKKIKLSIAVFPGMLKQFYKINPDKRERFRMLAKHVDQFVLMMYDTGIDEESKFYNHMASNIDFMDQLIEERSRQEMFIGIASYGWHSNKTFRWMHDPRIENIRTSLLLLKQYLKRHPGKTIIDGCAVFRFGTTDKNEWEQYSKEVQ